MADAKVTSLSEVSVPDLADILYLVDDPAGTPTSAKASLNRILGMLNSLCDGRLTLESGVPVSSTDQTSKTTVYFTPFNGNCVSLYDGTRWKQYQFSELSLALGTLTSDKNYDVFLYDNAGTLTLILGPAWSSDTARGTGAGTTELETYAGVLVNKVSIASGPAARAGRYLGTIRTASTTVTEDSDTKRFVWNCYNRVSRGLYNSDSNAHTYDSGTVREWNNSSAIRVHFVLGQTTCVYSRLAQFAYENQVVGINFDVTTSQINPYVYGNGVTPQSKFGLSPQHQILAAGYHYGTVVESVFPATSQNFTEAYISVEFQG